MSYSQEIDSIVAEHFPQLAHDVYLDHAGTTIVPATVLHRSTACLLQQPLGNPHLQLWVSRASDEWVETARRKVLRYMFGVGAGDDTYDLVFVANATAGVKLVAEGMRDTFGSAWHYRFAEDCHTSVVGARELAGTWECVPSDCVQAVPAPQPPASQPPTPTLVAWTGQSNLNGERWGCEVSTPAYTLFDAALLCTTRPPRLGPNGPDFVVCLFYKIFGCPDLGALVFRKLAAARVFAGRRYFGGGSVDALSPSTPFVARTARWADRLADGTLPIHSIVQLDVALDWHREVYGSFEAVLRHVAGLTVYAAAVLGRLAHANGRPMVQLLHPPRWDYGDPARQGPILALLLRSPDGTPAGYHDFERMAVLLRVLVRTGTVCNIGGVMRYTGMDPAAVEQNYHRGHRCGDSMDVIDGVDTGVVRVLFGAMSRKLDVDAFADQVQQYFANTLAEQPSQPGAGAVVVTQLWVYPIKLCAGFQVPVGVAWPVDASGLLYDRMFCLLDEDFGVVQLKHAPRMVHLHIEVSLARAELYIGGNGESVTVPLLEQALRKQCRLQTAPGGQFEYLDDPRLGHLLLQVVGRPCRLGRPCSTERLHNTSAMLLVTAPLLLWMQQQLPLHQFNPQAFRANVVVDAPGLVPWAEDHWRELSHGRACVRVVGRCDRCHMITIDPATGKRHGDVFLQLSKARKHNGKVYFGLKLAVESRPFVLAVGAVLSVATQ